MGAEAALLPWAAWEPCSLEQQWAARSLSGRRRCYDDSGLQVPAETGLLSFCGRAGLGRVRGDWDEGAPARVGLEGLVATNQKIPVLG